ncbi:helix-turn-helix domain-containing protein [Rhizobium lentis]|uniref:helix-turn-helix transcriptional regulator n=1 Tax=Rhizobium lentis TaxID=1138194 RepID=UPI001A913CCE|nr:AraC family transcriptional regulator [Rhizobium lentis]MBX4999246.1 helix-turn-helix domain-containing protein [Rhizobium lentis]MBX5015464.1 helix-turn-helix domain-containing protein [Rhizobium lentis]MBX5043919.1 helix-turn-helix domain-containing protein [Rhizobium lentis]MBX5056822.1 helix-turn-helix domain-containing protein [Rhizobium lentis]MBX5067069.1 helix-turn-helix domain-containing protein [Rhizobium lentis]
MDASIHRYARGEWHGPSLSHRRIHFQKGLYADFHHFLLLGEGRADFHFNSGEQRLLQGPLLAFLPPQARCDLLIAAGTAAHLVGASPQVMVDAIGEKVESYSLRIFTEQRKLVEASDPLLVAEIAPLISGFVREIDEPSRASWMAASAYMRLILMTLWRGTDGERSEQRGQGETGSILQRYRQLVEAGFRQHRPISDYAAELGVTADRLHAVCQRSLGRSPIQLLHERVVQEAKLRLERSARNIQEISDSLGFRDPTYFSHFFKRKTGLSPAGYREIARASAGSENRMLSSGYADWP